MNQKITRRQFSQLAIASTAAAGLSYFANKTFAQTPNLTIIGVRPGSTTSKDSTASPELNSTEVDSTTKPTAASIPLGLVLQSLDLVNGQVQNLPTPQVLSNGSTPILQSNEELSGFTALANGKLVVAITPVSGSKNEANPTRLTVLGTSPTTVNISGLKKQEKLSSLVGANDGGLLGIVLQKNGRPPVKLVNIDLQTGNITESSRIKLPDNQRFITLTQCPDGTFYTITVAEDGTSNLVKLDQAQKKPVILAKLTLNGSVLNNGLQSLVCSSGGQLLAFGARRYETPNNVYTVDAITGAVSLLQQFDVTKVTIIRA